MGIIRTSELTSAALDWAVAKCEGFGPQWDEVPEDFYLAADHMHNLTHLHEYNPSTNWAQGGPIIERGNITIIRADSVWNGKTHVPNWFAETSEYTGHSLNTSYENESMEPTFMVSEYGGNYGPTPLIAAMRCYVASKLGDTIEVPDELIKT